VNAATDGQRDWARRQDNVQPRRYGGGRPPKLTPAQRDEIRQRLADCEKARDLAREYGVSLSLIYQHRP
jgi:transposase